MAFWTPAPGGEGVGPLTQTRPGAASLYYLIFIGMRRIGHTHHTHTRTCVRDLPPVRPWVGHVMSVRDIFLDTTPTTQGGQGAAPAALALHPSGLGWLHLALPAVAHMHPCRMHIRPLPNCQVAPTPLDAPFQGLSSMHEMLCAYLQPERRHLQKTVISHHFHMN